MDHFYCIIDDIEKKEDYYLIKAYKVDDKKSFHSENESIEDKYGLNSIFFSINKLSKPSFLLHYKKALENAKLETRTNILNLGVNRGDEFEVMKKLSKNFSEQKFLGIDYCSSAIKEAEDLFANDKNISFLQADIKELASCNIGEYDLIVSIATLQSSNLEFNKTLMDIVQNHLKKDGAMILGFPNCRWVGDNIFYGAKAKNYSFSEMSLLYKDVMFCKKYLQQKKFRVTITGKDYIFLTATSIRQ